MSAVDLHKPDCLFISAQPQSIGKIGEKGRGQAPTAGQNVAKVLMSSQHEENAHSTSLLARTCIVRTYLPIYNNRTMYYKSIKQ